MSKTKNTAQSFARAAVKREILIAKQGNAKDAIGDLDHGCELYIMTFGQFSLMHVLVELLRQCGPADVDICTWTAGTVDLIAVNSLLFEVETIKNLRFIVDTSFANRQPAYLERMRSYFGDDCIRACRTHAKFMAIRNESWTLAVRTSMNLNQNPRLENVEISDDADLCGFLCGVTDKIFKEHEAGDFKCNLPELLSIENVEVDGLLDLPRPTSGKVSKKGTITFGANG